MKGTSRTILISAAGILAVAGFVLLRYLRSHSFSAREKPMAVEAFVARHLRRLAVPPGTNDMKNPVEITPLVLAEARDHFADHCATCHGNTGDGRTMISHGLYPPAPDMGKEETQQLTDGELFYIIKNGIRFTGMPGWGGKDEDNWKLVAFIRHLPKLAEGELKLMEEVNGMPRGMSDHDGH